MSPPVICPLEGSSRLTAAAVVDFPDPDSPTTATVCPGKTSRETSRTTVWRRALVPNATERFLMERTGEGADIACFSLLLGCGKLGAELDAVRAVMGSVAQSLRLPFGGVLSTTRLSRRECHSRGGGYLPAPVLCLVQEQSRRRTRRNLDGQAP